MRAPAEGCRAGWGSPDHVLAVVGTRGFLAHLAPPLLDAAADHFRALLGSQRRSLGFAFHRLPGTRRHRRRRRLWGDRLRIAVRFGRLCHRGRAGGLTAAAVEDPEIRVEIAYPAGRDHALGGTAAEIASDRPDVALLCDAVAAAMPGRGLVEGAPFWSESPFFVNRLGVPAVYCAPGDIRNCHTFEEHVGVEEYLAGIVAFASFMAGYCGVID